MIVGGRSGNWLGELGADHLDITKLLLFMERDMRSNQLVDIAARLGVVLGEHGVKVAAFKTGRLLLAARLIAENALGNHGADLRLALMVIGGRAAGLAMSDVVGCKGVRAVSGEASGGVDMV